MAFQAISNSQPWRPSHHPCRQYPSRIEIVGYCLGSYLQPPQGLGANAVRLVLNQSSPSSWVRNPWGAFAILQHLGPGVLGDKLLEVFQVNDPLRLKEDPGAVRQPHLIIVFKEGCCLGACEYHLSTDLLPTLNGRTLLCK